MFLSRKKYVIGLKSMLICDDTFPTPMHTYMPLQQNNLLQGALNAGSFILTGFKKCKDDTGKELEDASKEIIEIEEQLPCNPVGTNWIYGRHSSERGGKHKQKTEVCGRGKMTARRREL